MHAHRIHLPHLHARHPDLRHLARDAAIAAEVALASVVLTGSIEVASHLRADHSSVATPAVAAAVSDPVAAAPARVAILRDSARPTGEVHMPAGGELTLQVVDPNGAVVLSAGPVTEATQSFDLRSGSYRVVATLVGPVEAVGEVSITSSTVVRSELFELTSPGSFVVAITRMS